MDDNRRCTAKAKQTGNRCKRAAIIGGTVCKIHGGGSPKVINKARQRIMEAADPAAARMVELIDSDDERISLAASKDLMDRAGHKAPTEVKIESVDDAARIVRDELERRDRDQ